MARNKKLILSAMLAVCLAGIYALISGLPNKNRPNIILISFDALRPDHMGCYGYSRDTTPHIDEFAKHATQYLNCYSAGSWTIPANYSLITSRYLWQHNMDDWNLLFDKRIPSLFSLLGSRGYSQGFFSNSDFIGKDLKTNFGGMAEISCYKNAGLATQKALDWIKSRRKPFLAWIYYFEPHRPYISPYNNLYAYPPGLQLPIQDVDMDNTDRRGGWDYIPRSMADKDIGDVNHYIALYDGKIHYADEEAGKLLEGLKRAGLFENALVILVSDHGESLGEHHLYFNHIWTLFDEVLRIPLIVKLPGQKEGGKVSKNTGIVDILPTVLQEAGIKECRGCAGMPLGKDSAPDRERELFSFLSRDMYCLISDNWKLIKYPADHGEGNKFIRNYFPGYGQEFYQLFNRKTDPAELKDLKGAQQEQFKKMFSIISGKKESARTPAQNNKASELNEEEKAKLRSLGYLQ